MKLFLSILFILGSMCCMNTFSQNDDFVDSLNAIYNNTENDDNTRFKALIGLTEYYVYKDSEQAQHFLSKSYELAKANNEPEELARCWVFHGLISDIGGKKDTGIYYYRKALDYYQSVGNSNKVRSMTYNLAMYEHNLGNFDKAIEMVSQNIIPIELVTKEDARYQALSYGLLCRVYRDKGFYQIALDYGLKALKMAEITENVGRKADALRDLAVIENYLQHDKEAISYFLESMEIYRAIDDQYFLSHSLIDLGSIHFHLNELGQAEKYLLEGQKIVYDLDMVSSKVYVHVNLGDVYTKMSKLEKAQEHYDMATLALEQDDDPPMQAALSRSMGNLLIEKKQYTDALPYLNEAISISENFKDLPVVREAYFTRSVYFERVQDFKAALSDFKVYNQLSDSLYNSQQVTAIEEMRVIHDTENKENEIILLAKNLELDKIKRTRLWIILSGVIAIACLLFWFQWQRRKKDQEIASAKRKVIELEKEQLKTELEFKRQELASKVLQLCRKSEFLQSLNEDVSELKINAEGFNKQHLAQLSRKIDQDLNTDAFWDEFLKSFEEVHPNFNNLLHEKHPDFVPNEIRLAHLMRMNLQTKDIASLLNITPEGVKKARYRMRKKMGEDSSVDLTEYFVNFENTFKSMVA